MSWTLYSDRPIYLQLVEQVQHLILSGTYRPGDKLPSVRDLAAEASVNPNTMQKALAELEGLGLVFTNRTSGRYITEDSEMLENMKYDLAKKQFDEFIKKLYQLGFDKNEIIHFVKESAMEEKILN